jgi:hypothetical protein
VIASRFRLGGIAAKWSASIALRFNASSELGLSLRVVRRIVGLSAAVHSQALQRLSHRRSFSKSSHERPNSCETGIMSGVFWRSEPFR